MNSFQQLEHNISQCQLCTKDLEFGVNPVVQINPKAQILVAGQAPGRKVHESNIPFDDASGDKLRSWMGIDKTTFYDKTKIAILPMGFCYPGKGKSGDLPPRKECAKEWRQKVLDQLPNIKLTLLIGQYAIKWHLRERVLGNLTETVQNWRQFPDNQIPLPHPSPRNFIWFNNNPWFEQDMLPELRVKVASLIID